MDEVQIIRQYVNEQVANGAKREDVINDLRKNDDPRIQYFIKDYLGEETPKKEEPGLGQLNAETAAAVVVGKKILDMFGKGPAEPPSPPPGGGAVAPPVAPSAPAPVASPIPPASNVGQQMQGLDWEKLPQWQKDVLLAGYKAEQDKKAALSFEETRLAKQKEAMAAINQSPAAAQAAQQAVQQTVAPTVAQTAQQQAPAITQASQAPAETIPSEKEVEKKAPAGSVPPTGKKRGAPTLEERAAKEAARAAFVPPPMAEKIPQEWGKGMNWLIGSKGVDGAQAFINQYNEGKPFDSHAEFDKKWKEVTGVSAGPTYKDIPKDVRKQRGISPSAPQYSIENGFAIPKGAAVPPSSGSGGGGFLQKPTTPGGMLHNLNPLRLE